MIIFLRIAIRNVRVNWRHSLAALISIGCAYFSLVIFQGYIYNTQELYYAAYHNRAMYGDMVIQNKSIFSKEARLSPFKFYMTSEDQAIADEFLSQRAADVKAKVRFLEVQGVVTNGLTSNIFVGEGHDVEQGWIVRGKIWQWNTIYGNPLEKVPQKDSVLLGRALARVVGCVPEKIETTVSTHSGYKAVNRPFKCQREDLQFMSSTETGQVNAFDLTAVGLIDGGYKELDSRIVSMSLQNAQLMLNTKKITYETVLLHDTLQAPSFIADFNSFLATRAPHLHAISWQKHPHGEMYVKTMSVLYVFRNFVVLVIGVISSLTVLSSTMKTVTERTREIGTLQSLGFNKKKVLLIFLLESMGLGLLGCLIGGAAALTATFSLNAMEILYQPANLSQPIPLYIAIVPGLYIFAVVALLVLNVATVWIACRRVLKKSIVECLIHA